MYSTTAIVKKTLRVVAKNGYYIHAIHIILIMCRCNICLTSFIVMKLYSVNYFYWYGTQLFIFANPRYNWTKQFIRFTDSGHVASFMILVWPSLLPLAHNVHFIIFMGYFLGKFCFGLKDADRIVELLYLFIYSKFRKNTHFLYELKCSSVYINV